MRHPHLCTVCVCHVQASFSPPSPRHPLHGQRWSWHQWLPVLPVHGKDTVVFGSVVEGMEVVEAVEAVGSDSGKTSKKVVIADCGQC